jgi:hypothetical protein
MASRPRPKKKEVGFPRRGEIYIVHFDPTVGHEAVLCRAAFQSLKTVCEFGGRTRLTNAFSMKWDKPEGSAGIAFHVVRSSAVCIRRCGYPGDGRGDRE